MMAIRVFTLLPYLLQIIWKQPKKDSSPTGSVAKPRPISLITSTSCINGMEVVVKYLTDVTTMGETDYKILFADLDGTLITTASGKTFPEGIWDMKLRLDTLEAIKKLAPKRVFIVSNQGGIEKGYSTDYLFTTKIHYVCRCIEEYCGIDVVDYEYCKSNSKSDPRRKPNTGMLQLLYNDFVENTNLGRRDALMIGDASGKPGQWSDSDKKTAENFGIDYLDVEDFIKAMKK